MVPDVPTVVTWTGSPPTAPMSFSAWIAASFSRWVVRARPNVPAKSTSQSRGVVVRRASSTSSRRNGREASTRNAMYRYRGRCVLTLGDGGEVEKGSGKKRRRSVYFVHFGGRLDEARVHVLAEERLRLDARDHQEHANRVLQVVLDGTTPDDPRLRVDLLAHNLRGLLRLGHGQVRSADDELEELVVVDDDRRVAELAELVQAGLRVLHPDAAFGLEGHRDDAHREGAFLLRDAGDVLCGAGPGPAAHARGDEHDVRAAEEVSNLFLVLVGGLFADLREGSGTEAFREALADEDLLRRVDGEQVLGVRVHGGQLRARDPGLAASVDRVRSAPAAADDLDRDIDRLHNLFDLFVVAVLLLFHGLGFLGLALFLRLGFLVPGQGFVEK